MDDCDAAGLLTEAGGRRPKPPVRTAPSPLSCAVGRLAAEALRCFLGVLAQDGRMEWRNGSEKVEAAVAVMLLLATPPCGDGRGTDTPPPAAAAAAATTAAGGVTLDTAAGGWAWVCTGLLAGTVGAGGGGGGGGGLAFAWLAAGAGAAGGRGGAATALAGAAAVRAV